MLQRAAVHTSQMGIDGDRGFCAVPEPCLSLLRVSPRPSPQWNGFGTFFRAFASVYDGKVVGLPVSAAIMLFYYRYH